MNKTLVASVLLVMNVLNFKLKLDLNSTYLTYNLKFIMENESSSTNFNYYIVQRQNTAFQFHIIECRQNLYYYPCWKLTQVAKYTDRLMNKQ